MLKPSKVKVLVFFLLFILIYSSAFSLFYSYFTTTNRIEEFDKRFKNIQGQLTVDLPEKDSYLIKIWSISYPEKVYFNNVEVSPFRLRERGILKEMYIKVEGALLNKSHNALNIISEVSHSVRIKNFYGATDSKAVFVLFKSSRFLKFDFAGFMLVATLTFLILVATWIIFYFTIDFIFRNFQIRVFLVNYCLGNFSFLLLTAILTFLLALTDYRVILSKECFLSWAIFLFSSINLFGFLSFIFKQRKALVLEDRVARIIASLIRVSYYESNRSFLEFYLEELVRNFKKTPSQYLISVFILLCFVCMVLLVFRLDSIANWVSYFAYFCLSAGIIIMFRELIKEENK